jgi:hypothetical protein
MGFEEWVAFFGARGYVDVCSRDTGFNDLALDVNEELGCCLGPAAGCAKGCCSFWRVFLLFVCFVFWGAFGCCGTDSWGGGSRRRRHRLPVLSEP